MVKAIVDVLAWVLFVVGLAVAAMIGFTLWALINNDSSIYYNALRQMLAG